MARETEEMNKRLKKSGTEQILVSLDFRCCGLKTRPRLMVAKKLMSLNSSEGRGLVR